MQYNHHRSHACTLLCTALALAFGCAAAHAADVKISGSVITGLYFNKVEGADNGNLKMGGAGELPNDPHLMLTAREDLGNGWYTGAQLQNRFYPDSGTFRSNGYLFDAQSRLFVVRPAAHMCLCGESPLSARTGEGLATRQVGEGNDFDGGSR